MATNLSAHKQIPAERRAAPRMEGAMARWYARNRGSANQLAQYRDQAAELTAPLPDGADVLEVAPGPGFLSVELAREGRVHVTAVDLSHTFVGIAADNARRAGVRVDVRHGDAGDLPFADRSFHLVVCQAAFKNFPKPVAALDEMHRVLRPGGVAVIDDMNHEATRDDIDQEVAAMGVSKPNAAFTRLALGGLRRRAASPAQFTDLVARSVFRTCTVTTAGIGLRVRMTRGPEA